MSTMQLTQEYWAEKVKQWDVDSPGCLAPLSTKQKDLVVELRAYAFERPVPVSSFSF
jgi:hypothetical protein